MSRNRKRRKSRAKNFIDTASQKRYTTDIVPRPAYDTLTYRHSDISHDSVHPILVLAYIDRLCCVVDAETHAQTTDLPRPIDDAIHLYGVIPTPEVEAGLFARLFPAPQQPSEDWASIRARATTIATTKIWQYRAEREERLRAYESKWS